MKEWNFPTGELRVIFENGALINKTSLSEIRNRLN